MLLLIELNGFCIVLARMLFELIRLLLLFIEFACVFLLVLYILDAVRLMGFGVVCPEFIGAFLPKFKALLFAEVLLVLA